MVDHKPNGAQRWREVLRRAGIALSGQTVGVFESDARGHLHPLAVSDDPAELPDSAIRELERRLGEWKAERAPGRRWLASRLDTGRWCVAPVPSALPEAPPSGIERRGRERLLLELAGVCLSLLEGTADLAHGALHDPLTDLPNRTYFTERVAQALERVRRDSGYQFAVLFLDFDDFKVVNDSLGHAQGDRLLRGIAERLHGCLRPGDVVARLGGDEFTVLLEEVAGVADAEHAARRVHRALATSFDLEGRDVFVSASIGVALSSPGYERPEDLLRDADIAMYRAKERGRSRHQVFDIAMREWAHARFGMEADLRGALERGEFHLAFQPIVKLDTGRVYGFEALLRWHHHGRGIIPPPEFIPLAEQTGLIVPIGAWALREACWHAGRWRRAYPRAGLVRVNVNLSARQLGHPRLVDEVRRALSEAQLEPGCLGLEITESVLMEDVEAAAVLLGQLRALRVDLHIDDFGTGYSSLSYLPRLPIQVLKVDRSIVHRMGGRRTDLEIVRSIVDLAKNLGLAVIAEGVETPAQRERLQAFGCELGQGFLFSAPLDPAQAGALLGADPRRPA